MFFDADALTVAWLWILEATDTHSRRDLCTEPDHTFSIHEASRLFGQQVLRCELLAPSVIIATDYFPLVLLHGRLCG
jgi:hypothetical protein